MSVYRDTNTTVYFEHPFAGPLDAAIFRGGVQIGDVTGIVKSGNSFPLNLTFRETQFDGDLEIRWTGMDGIVPFLRTQCVPVRTPLAPLSRLRTLFNNTNLQDEELAELENNVRLVIEAHTGQSFGYEIGKKYVTGTGDKRIALPMRLARLVGITGGPAGYFGVSADGWSLYIHNKNLLTIKEMPPEEFVDNVYMTHGVIHVPDAYWKQFRVGATYEIDGEWGYPTVPGDVQEAALLLANDFGTGENLYRDRYLEAIKSGDWNLTFTAGAFRGTGNARADALLEKYRKQGMVII